MPRCSHPLCACSTTEGPRLASQGSAAEWPGGGRRPPRCTSGSEGRDPGPAAPRLRRIRPPLPRRLSASSVPKGRGGPAPLHPRLSSVGVPSLAAPRLLGPGGSLSTCPGVKGPAPSARCGPGAESARGKRDSVALSAAAGGGWEGRGRGSAGLGSGSLVARRSPLRPGRGRGGPGLGARCEWPRAGKMLHLRPPRAARTARLPRR